MKKLLHFLSELRKNTIIESFSDSHYQSLVTIPNIKLEKNKQNIWIAKVWIAEELFDYVHPFILPHCFYKKHSKDSFEVQFKIIEVFCSENIEKRFFIKEFLNSYPSKVSNKRKTNIKNIFIDLIYILRDHNLIESDFKIISGESFKNVKELTSNNIKEGFLVYEKINF